MTTLLSVYQAGKARLAELEAAREALRKELDFTENQVRTLALQSEEMRELTAMVKAGLVDPALVDLALGQLREARAEKSAAEALYRESPEVQALKAYETALAEVKRGISTASQAQPDDHKAEKLAVEPVDHLSVDRRALMIELRERLMPQARGKARKDEGLNKDENPGGAAIHVAFVALAKTWLIAHGYGDKRWNWELAEEADSRDFIKLLKEAKVEPVAAPVVEQQAATGPVAVAAPASEMFHREYSPVDNDMDVVRKPKPRQARKEPTPKGKAVNTMADLVAKEKARAAAAKAASLAEAAKAEKRHQAALKSAETRRKNKAAAEQAASQSAS